MTYFFQKTAMKSAAASLGHEVFASCDYLKKDGKSCGQKFVSFADYTQFADTILASTNHCCFYEMIREDMPCKMYFDVEWVASACTGSFGLAGVQDVIADEFARSFAGTPLGDGVVLQSSRATSTGFKHSYHLVYPLVVFMRNNGRLKRFAEVVSRTVHVRFGVKAVDTSVYSRDRAFRAPLCHKLSDASRTRLQWVSQPDDLRAHMLLSMVCYVRDSEASMITEDTPAVAAAGGVHRRPCARVSRSRPPVSERWVSLLRDALHRFLADKGGRGVVQRHSFMQHSNGSISFRYSHGEPGRQEPCLRHGPNGGVSHRHDNQFVTITAGSFVYVSCPHGSKCNRGVYNFGRLTKMHTPILECLLHAL
jgi:hypothetical protein